MGSVKKVFKKATKVIKKPISKITKGIARGVAKVAKSVMKGVGKLNAKLGPIGMIAMSIAMPYAMGGLSNMIGRGAMSGIHGPTGWMGSKNVFLRSIGNVGNAIRTGYNGVTGAIGRFTKGITRSITEGFSKMSGGKGNGLWSKISNGAKNLFTRARNTVKKFTPKFRTGTSGTVDVTGLSTHPIYGQGTSTMTSGQASQLLKSGAIDASQLSNQTLGSAEGWFTKAGSSNADKLVTETLNSTFDSTIGSSLDTNGSRWINDLYTNGTGNSRYANKWDAYDSVKGNNAWRTTSDGTFVDLSATGDYTMGTTQPGKATEYTFNGSKSFDTKVSNTNGIKKKVADNSKKWIQKKAIDYGKSLFAPDAVNQEFEGIVTSGAEFADGESGALTSSSLQEGATGSSSYADVFGTAAWQKLKGYHRNMNYQGDMDYYGVK